MAKQLSTDAIDTLRHLNAMQTGEVAPPLSPVVVAELLSAGLVAKAGSGGVEITCDGRKYLSGDCD